MVANVITFQTKGAIRGAAKALGINEDRAIEVLYRGKSLDSNEDASEFENCKKVADELFELPRHLGIHSGGFVITQEPLTHLTPIEPATMEGRSVIQWNKDDIESLGLFKIDILALGMLTALRKTFASLARQKVPGTLLPVTLENIPPNCPKTYDMIRRARTTGVFQIESRAQMSILPRILPREFYDLVVSIGIVRPGPIVSGMVGTYVKRRMGKEQAVYPDPKLRSILQRTLGVPIFQEQIMRIAMAVADFSPGEADELRRAMGAWKMNGNMKSFEEKLRTGMKRNNIPNDFAEVIFKQVEGFSQYGFPESHSTSFAHIAYASAWLKAHFPAHFLCGLLNSQPMGFYSPHSLLQEAKLSGVRISEPCLFTSQWNSGVDSKGAVQLGFSTLKTIREEHVTEFIIRRKHLTNPNAIYEILSCFHTHERIALAMGGCFRTINTSRRDVLWKLLASSHTLLNDSGSWIFPQKSNAAENWDNVRDDFSTKGYAIEQHPMEAIKNLCWPFDFDINKVTLSNNLASLRDGAIVSVSGLVVIRQRPPTAKGMVFITLEDECGTINLILKPDIFDRWKELIVTSDLMCCSGIRQSNGRESTILVRTVHPLVQAVGPPQQMIELNTSLPQQDSIFGTCPEI
jgi:error-prone DNA polymerase